jgi:hypothetical protein
VNEFGYSALITDQTDLTATLTNFGTNSAIKFEVSDGQYVRPGNLLLDARNVAIPLLEIPEKLVTDPENPSRFKLPSRAFGELLIQYGAIPKDVCQVVQDSSGYGNELLIKKGGNCLLGASIPLSRSHYNVVNNNSTKWISIIARSKAEADAEAKAKADAEAKAKADAEAKAKADAEARAKELAEKPGCDARKKDLSTLSQDFVKFKKENPSKSDEVDSTLARLNSALNSNCVAEITLADFQREYQDLTKSSSKKTTITCTKGKLSKKVTAVKPKCPKGYKKK